MNHTILCLKGPLRYYCYLIWSYYFTLMLLFPAGAEGSRAPRADIRVKGAVEGGLCPGNCELTHTRVMKHTFTHTKKITHSLSHTQTSKEETHKKATNTRARAKTHRHSHKNTHSHTHKQTNKYTIKQKLNRHTQTSYKHTHSHTHN